MSWKPMKITKSGHKKLLKKISQWKKQQKNWWKKPAITWYGWKNNRGTFESN